MLRLLRDLLFSMSKFFPYLSFISIFVFVLTEIKLFVSIRQV